MNPDDDMKPEPDVVYQSEVTEESPDLGKHVDMSQGDPSYMNSRKSQDTDPSMGDGFENEFHPSDRPPDTKNIPMNMVITFLTSMGSTQIWVIQKYQI